MEESNLDEEPIKEMRPGTAPSTAHTDKDLSGLGEDSRPTTAPTKGVTRPSFEDFEPPNRSSSSLSISDVHENAHDSMLNFLHMHMTSILRPFSDSLQELHTNADAVAGNIREIMGKLGMNTSLIAEQGAAIDGLRTELASTIRQANGTQAQLELSTKEWKAAEKTLEGKITHVREKIPPIQMSVKELWKGIDDTRVQIMSKHKADIDKVNETMGGFLEDHVALKQEHAGTVDLVNMNKLAFDQHVDEFGQMSKEMKTLQFGFEVFKKDTESRFCKCEETGESLQKQLLTFQRESQQTHEAAVKMLVARLDNHDVGNEEVLRHLKVLDEGLAEANKHIVENGENFNKLVRHMEERRISDLQKMRSSIEKAEADIAEHARTFATKEEQEAIEKRQQEDIDYHVRRLKRLDKVLGLPKMSKEDPDDDGGLTLKNGILLTDAQVKEFRKTFDRYDSDGSGQIDRDEIRQILESVGADTSPEILEIVFDDIDPDHSGEIDFDEFCCLMGKMMGPDGKVDMDAYLKNVSSAAAREAKQNRMIELVPIMNEDLKKQTGILEQEKVKLSGTTDRVHSLEGNHASLMTEVQKLRKGLELTQEYWKGFSRGLKETKKTVRSQGDELLPNGNRMPILPPLEPAVKPPVTR